MCSDVYNHAIYKDVWSSYTVEVLYCCHDKKYRGRFRSDTRTAAKQNRNVYSLGLVKRQVNQTTIHGNMAYAAMTELK